MEAKIGSQLNSLQKFLSVAKEQDLAKVMEELTKVESQINSLKNQEETVSQFGYYKYQLAKIFIDSGKFSDQQFMYEEYLKLYFNDYQEYSEQISKQMAIQNQFKINDQLISLKKYLSIAKDEDQDKTNEKLSTIESLINSLQNKEETITQFGYYNYELAKICIDSGKLEHQKFKYEKYLQFYFEDYQNYSQTILNEITRQNKIKLEDLLNQKIDEIYKKNMKTYYLVLGNTGDGKSSFIKKVTGNQNVQTSNQKQSHTQECQIFYKDGKNYIDSPGINDTQRDRYDILLSIVKFLHQQKLNLNNLFILLIQKEELKSLTLLQEFSYTYFLYELFLDNIDYTQVKRLIQEYYDSHLLLNWSEVGLHSKQDDLSEKRVLIFQNKDRASNYFEYIYTYHIAVFTFFDKKRPQMHYFDDYQINILKQQIWSEKNQGQSFNTYNDYIKDQETHLLKKIEQIQKLEIYNKQIEENKQFQNILLIGKSQVGKSSLIEQLTELKGLRGSGEKSETQICNIYRVDYGNVVYRFIDTPGYEGTENNQCPYHNFKIIGDYLRRQDINEFKLLFMINKDLDNRDTIQKVLDEFFVFIEDIFNQDVSFVDTDQLECLFLGQQEADRNRNKIIFKDKILQIFRLQYGEVDSSQEQFECTVFNCNFFTRNGLYKIEKEQDLAQKKQLFEKINMINYISLEDKVVFQIKNSLRKSIISKSEGFMIEFNRLAELHLELSKFDQQINDIKQSKMKKYEIIRQLKKIQFYVIGNVYMQIIEKVKQSQYPNTIKNDALRHFLPIDYTSALFEITEEKPESMFVSRKQHYYSLLAHQLSRFIDINNEKHKKKLENLAELKVAQEICNHNIEHQKYIESSYERKAEENIEELYKLSNQLNAFKSYGIAIYKNVTYTSMMVQQLRKFSCLGINLCLDVFLIPLLFGYDITQQFKGILSSKLFQLNTTANILVANCLVLNDLPVIKQFKFSILEKISGYSSKKKFDLTIGQYLRKIINDLSPNQHLKYYESSQLLNQNFKFNKYAQLQESTGYEMFTKLEKDNFNLNEKILTNLYKPENNQNLKDLVSNHIVKNYILRDMEEEYKQISQSDGENYEYYLCRVIQLLENRKQQIEVFYNRSQKFVKLKSKYDTLISILKEKLEEEQISNYKKICKESIQLMKDKFKQIQNLNSEKKQQNEQKDKVQQRESETQIQNLNSEQKQINEKQDEIQLSECETYIWNYNSEQKQINEQQEEIQLSKCETQRWSYNSKLKQINEQQDEIQLSECETYIWNYNSEQKQINEQQEEIQLSGSETQIQNLNSEKKQQNEQQEKVQFSQSEEQILKNFKTKGYNIYEIQDCGKLLILKQQFYLQVQRLE
ncbi:hypothetical protein ABPG74_019953 [Tetrahymena malaccensis]